MIHYELKHLLNSKIYVRSNLTHTYHANITKIWCPYKGTTIHLNAWVTNHCKCRSTNMSLCVHSSFNHCWIISFHICTCTFNFPCIIIILGFLSLLIMCFGFSLLTFSHHNLKWFFLIASQVFSLFPKTSHQVISTNHEPCIALVVSFDHKPSYIKWFLANHKSCTTKWCFLITSNFSTWKTLRVYMPHNAYIAIDSNT